MKRVGVMERNSELAANQILTTVFVISLIMIFGGVLGVSQYFLLRRAINNIKAKHGSQIIQYFGIFSSSFIILTVVLFIVIGIYFLGKQLFYFQGF
jgi:hypothetical protein